jgi:hypothetical protein
MRDKALVEKYFNLIASVVSTSKSCKMGLQFDGDNQCNYGAMHVKLYTKVPQKLHVKGYFMC